ncbi:hypothetical protein PVAND_002600 [Polypedilum vanderplanki]|uniref:trypsin n=1 Tax=Polypedilum vanderplanki TaxID=319348 RepID=A0A9J6BRH2_POLVA|nr:hypothetical protein PVAND_002600 [Polypedilum vanderplanki]
MTDTSCLVCFNNESNIKYISLKENKDLLKKFEECFKTNVDEKVLICERCLDLVIQFWEMKNRVQVLDKSYSKALRKQKMSEETAKTITNKMKQSKKKMRRNTLDERKFNRKQIKKENEFGEGLERIVGGQIMQIESVPYMVSIFYKNNHLCGGSIISRQWIISAAHCVVDTDAKNYWVRSGSSRKSRGGTVTNAEKIIPHPDYDTKTLNYDFMLLKISHPLIYSERQQPIKIADDSSRAYFAGEEVLTSGFGLTQNDMESNEFLRGVIVKFSSKNECLKAYPEIITENMVCAGSQNNQDSCQGDSGGPLESLRTGELVGIVSFGMSCADPSYPGVYSKVSKVKDWIEQTKSEVDN